MENYTEVFTELKNYFGSIINSFKKEIIKRIDYVSKDNKYFQDTFNKTAETKFGEIKTFIENEKQIINGLISENALLKTDLEKLKLHIENDKEIVIKEILNRLKSDTEFLDNLAEKIITKLEI